LGEVGIDPPIAFFVGVGQGAAGDDTAEASMEEFGFEGTKTDFDVAQAVAKSKLSESHAKKLIVAREGPDLVIATIVSPTLVEFVLGQVVQHLCEDVFPGVHQPLPDPKTGAKNG
jgi:hypothetical protein